MPKILIVEDDDIQRGNMKAMLQELGQEYRILDSSSAYHALDLLKSNSIDLFLIDIHLQNESGLKLARHIRRIPGYELTWIVFVTSYLEYILEAFKEIHCYDYLLKPYDKTAMHNLIKKLLFPNSGGKNTSEERKYIFVDINGIMAKVFIDDIIFIEVFGKLCIIHTTKGAYDVKNFTLTKLLGLMRDSKLIQSHRSYVVNTYYIQSINKNMPCWEIHFVNYEKTALVGGKYKENLMEACEKYSCPRR